MKATFELETVELELHGGPIAGVDEAGRGPLAGPVVAAAVVLDPARIPDGIADSKALDAKTRRSIYQEILAVGPGRHRRRRRRSHRQRQHPATPRCGPWRRRWRALDCRPKLVLIDGNKAPQLDCTTRTIVQGDAKCLSIAAASIVAKVARDAMMAELARDYPHYGFDRHKGYGTPRAPRRHRPARRHAPPSPLVPAGAAGPRAGVGAAAL